MVHELGHGLAAILTGGEFRNFLIAPDGSGLAYTAGGIRLIVVPAGYLSVAIFAALLIWLGRDHRWSRIALGFIGGAMLFMSLWFGLPADFSIGSLLFSGLTMISGVIFGAVFLRVAYKSTPATIVFFTHLVAIKAGFGAFSDTVGLIGLSTMADAPRTDAVSMAELTFVPAIGWAFIWIAMSVVIIGWAIKITWFPSGKNTL
ncbi:MAG: M50 family metallopeptidase [Chloroflexota bacterium]